MHRREMLRRTAMALAACGLPAPGQHLLAARASPALGLAVVEASWDRVLRTIVGLRPHRESGFVLTARAFADKLLIHNYGHGGAGMSLARGLGSMAADLALASPARRAAVIGCGTIGLCTAAELQRRGFEVTIFAAALPPDTTSNLSQATFTPTAGLVGHRYRRSPAWDRQFRQASELSYDALQGLADIPGTGVSRIDNYVATDSLVPPEQRDPLLDLLPERLRRERHQDVLGPGDHPFPTAYAIRTVTLTIDPSVYLDRLLRDVSERGGRLVQRRFTTPRELAALDEPIVVNCTGLGAKALFDDRDLVPVKGQLMVLPPQPEVTYRMSSTAADGWPIGMHPRADGILIGNLQQRGAWSLAPNADARTRSINAAIAFFARMRASISDTLAPTSEARAQKCLDARPHDRTRRHSPIA
jgi:D-amino-acid oxidase